MHYIDVKWLHDHNAEPVRLVSELDDQRLEVRKLEFFRDGAVGFATSGAEAGGTSLGAVAIPELDEINADPQFCGVELEAHTFEALWTRYAVNRA